jgi:hypothetical protein
VQRNKGTNFQTDEEKVYWKKPKKKKKGIILFEVTSVELRRELLIK